MGVGGKYERFGRAIDRCDSEVERRFLLTLLITGGFEFEPHGLAFPTVAIDPRGIILGVHAGVGLYTLDFTLTHAERCERLDVEIDGLEFHERTQKQAQHDRARDRQLLALGWYTCRFMAREIISSPFSSAGEALRIFAALAQLNGPTIVKAAPVNSSAALAIRGA